MDLPKRLLECLIGKQLGLLPQSFPVKTECAFSGPPYVLLPSYQTYDARPS